MNKEILVLIDRSSFPLKCPEVDLDLRSLIDREICDIEDYQASTPTDFYNYCLEQAELYDLVVPVTRNFYVRDKLRVEGVNFVLCL